MQMTIFTDVKIHIHVMLSVGNDVDKYQYKQNITYATVWLKPKMHIF